MLKKHHVAENQPFCEAGSSQTTRENSEWNSVNEGCALPPGVLSFADHCDTRVLRENGPDHNLCHLPRDGKFAMLVRQ